MDVQNLLFLRNKNWSKNVFVFEGEDCDLRSIKLTKYSSSNRQITRPSRI